MKYHFYAVLQQEGDDYNVYFPDLPGAITYGNNLEDAVFMAQDVLEGHLLVMEDDGDDIPKPSEYRSLINNIDDNEQLQLVTVDTRLIRIKEENKTVNKMVTLPQYMVVLGKEKGINFSQTLQRALKEELNI
ncbi:TPA: type II toxin-antitoxin system HicB family antitoxin [Staphylococcus aureus]|uniref:type II toxin-antitoxin system HicB family antitoxin n=1 Tax=Staphylococcus aureus TaxID=1280 RepID=UPI001165BBFC|nr:type II toxin-antitoxin system HicB family antitoxin [Staphylococcus aureus]NDP36514.1 HicB family protein [Staphylococcus aureus]NDP46685.1 HicB family protein [Staphylococcus aureus]NDP51972.1 HicB family protein [Staphylococcus aureus]NDP80652.1 HicB family protein [Staphylococcus aureus]NDQ18414.1 HicB family protein [Staphylococcus aureus]